MAEDTQARAPAQQREEIQIDEEVRPVGQIPSSATPTFVGQSTTKRLERRREETRAAAQAAARIPAAYTRPDPRPSDKVALAMAKVVDEDIRREMLAMGLTVPDVIVRDWATKRQEAEAIYQALGSPAPGDRIIVSRDLVEHVMPIAHQGVFAFIQAEHPEAQTRPFTVATKQMRCNTHVQTEMTDQLIDACGAVPVEGDTLLWKGH